MNFVVFGFGWIPMGWMQFAAFFIQMSVAFMCLMAIYVIAHQTLYTYRLMTAGPHGFEQASMFSLCKGLCTWRHLAIRCIFNGLSLYIVASGLLVFVMFVLFWDSYLPHPAPHVAFTWVERQVHGFDVPVAYMMCAAPLCVLLWDQYLIGDAGIAVFLTCSAASTSSTFQASSPSTCMPCAPSLPPCAGSGQDTGRRSVLRAELLPVSSRGFLGSTEQCRGHNHANCRLAV